MVNADVPGNVQRFLLGARERNIRLLFVRLFASEPDSLNANLEYVQKIAHGLARGRLEPGPAHGFRDLETGRVLRLLMGVAVAAGWLLLADAVTGLLGGAAGLFWPRLVAGAGALGLLVLPALSASAASTGYETGCARLRLYFPSLALLHADLLAPDRRTERACASRQVPCSNSRYGDCSQRAVLPSWARCLSSACSRTGFS
jgi:hypothetical protein